MEELATIPTNVWSQLPESAECEACRKARENQSSRWLCTCEDQRNAGVMASTTAKLDEKR